MGEVMINKLFRQGHSKDKLATMVWTNMKTRASKAVLLKEARTVVERALYYEALRVTRHG